MDNQVIGQWAGRRVVRPPVTAPELARQRRLLEPKRGDILLFPDASHILLCHRELKWRTAERPNQALLRTAQNGLCVIASYEDWPDGMGALLHVAVAYNDHLPDWDTMHAVRDAFFPDDIDVMMMLPRKENY